MTSLQEEIDAIFESHDSGFFGSQIDIQLGINRALQEFREEICEKQHRQMNKPLYNQGYNQALKDVLALIGEKK